MATKKAAKKAEPAKTAAENMSEEEKAAKKAARKEAMKNRPDGQRTNSKQCDVIETTNGTVKTYAMSVKGFGVVLTVVAEDKDGNVVSTAVTTVEGYTVKTKKGHGYLKSQKVKAGKEANEEADDDDEEEEDED